MAKLLDKILRETTTKAIYEKKLKVAGQPKIDLKKFGEGKDLNYELTNRFLPSYSFKILINLNQKNIKLKLKKVIIDE